MLHLRATCWHYLHGLCGLRVATSVLAGWSSPTRSRVRPATGVLGRRTQRRHGPHHLLWWAEAVDHVINAVSMRCPHALTHRRTALLVVVVSVLPHGELVPGTQCTLTLPPPRYRGAGSGCFVVVTFAADDTCVLCCSVQRRLPPAWLINPALAPALRGQWPADLYVRQLCPDAMVFWKPRSRPGCWRLQGHILTLKQWFL